MKKVCSKKQCIIGRVFALECVVMLAVVLVSAWWMKQDETVTWTPADLFLCEQGTVNADGSYSIDSRGGGYKGWFTCGPYQPIEKGIYRVNVNYTADGSDQIAYAFSETAEYIKNGIRCDRVVLNQDRNEKSFLVWVKEDLEDFEIRLEYDGEGSLTLSGMSIMKSKQTYLLLWAKCIGLLLAFNTGAGLYFLWRKNKLGRNQICTIGILGVIILWSSYPLFYDFLWYGTDLSFHLMRIVGIKDAIRSGALLGKLYPSWLNGYGYAVPVFYGDILLYVPALLRLIGVPLQTAYQMYCLMINILTCLVSYYVFYKMMRDNTVALFGSAMYTFSVFRMAMMYSRPMVGLSAGMIFLPLIFYGAYRVLAENVTERKYCTAWIPLAAGLTGIVQTHLLTCDMLVILIPILGVLLIRRVLRKPVFLMLCKAAAATVGINAGFLLPFLEGMRWNINITDRARDEVMYNIQSNGLDLGNLFQLFPQAVNAPYRTDYTVGVALLGGVILFGYVCFRQRKSRRQSYRKVGYLAVCLGIITMMMSTNLFPWDKLAEHLGVLSSLVRNLQFPWRFLAFATVFLVIAVCTAAYELRQSKVFFRQAILVLCLINVVSVEAMISNMVNDTTVVRAYDTEGLDGYDYEGGWGIQEYLPVGTDISRLPYGEIKASDAIQIADYQNKNGAIDFYCENPQEGSGYIELPLLHYPGYRAAEKNTKEKLVLENGENNVLRLLVPAFFAGEIEIRHEPSILWKASYIISLLAVAFTVCYWLRQRRLCREDDIVGES